MKIRVALLATTLAALSSTAVAAENAEVRTQVEECAQMKANLHRLNCYDDLAKGLGIKLAKTKKYVKKAPKSNVAAAPVTAAVVAAESDFGVEHVKEVEGPDSIAVVIKEVVKNAFGERKFYFENGQVWRQTDGVSSGKFPEGLEVTIERGVLGAFFLKKPGTNRTVKVKRIK